MFDLLNFSISGDGESYSLAKKALIFIEGNHKDSMGRSHEFDASRIKKFVDNTNNFIRSGGRLPFQMDHRKTQDFNIGDVEGELYTKVITEADLPNAKYRHLVGKVGVFVDNIIGRGKDVVDKINQGLIKTLSPGMDPMTESFIEISATPTPAIIGPALFSKEGDEIDNYILFEAMSPPKAGTSTTEDESTQLTKAFSYDELKSKKHSQDKLHKEYEELSEGLFEILTSIQGASEEELAAAAINPVDASYDAIEHFLSNLEEMFGLVDDGEAEKEEEKKAKNQVVSSAATGKQPYPVGKTASDYSARPIGVRKEELLEFSKATKPIGYSIK